MAIDRRAFLQILGGSAASLYAFDLDKLLWVPGEKKIFLPPERRLIYASEVVLSEWNHVMEHLKEIYNSDKLLYKLIIDSEPYKTEAGMYRNVKIEYGYRK